MLENIKREVLKFDFFLKTLTILTLLLFLLNTDEDAVMVYEVVTFIFLIIVTGTDILTEQFISSLVTLISAVIFNPFYKFDLTINSKEIFLTVTLIILTIISLTNFYQSFLKNTSSHKRKKRKTKKLIFDEKIGSYLVASSGFIYEIPPDMVDDLHHYLDKSKLRSVQDWHFKLPANLQQKVKKRILRSSDINMFKNNT